ncbi:MAG: DNA-binding protein [Bacteroidetes bacterium]|nr:DNA-binding protein [Bacteroidota bacterium]
MKIEDYIGNIKLLDIQKTAFLCSCKVPASIVLKSYDWAIQQREQGNCVISGFQSQIEKDVLHYLIKGTQPIIIALARGLKKNLEPEIKYALDQDRLLIITPFYKDVKRVNVKTAELRNLLMVELADKIVIGFASESGNLQKTLRHTRKPILNISLL